MLSPRQHLSPFALLAVLSSTVTLLGADTDCNGNGRPDGEDLQTQASLDCNRNGNPDECDVLPVNPSLSVTKTVDVLALTSVAISDLDGDGHADLAGTFLQQPQVSFHWGEGDARFSPVARVNIGNRSHFIVVVDMDRDGDPDIVTSGASDISLLLNDGGRTFRLAQSLQVAATPQSIVTGDLDGDGDLDLAADGEFEVLVFLSIGGVSFSKGDHIQVGSQPVAVAGGDLDGDGDLDLATANRLGNLSIVRNRGDATFETPTNLATGNESTWIVAEDLDGDRDLDLAVSHDSSVSVFRNQGDGSLDPPESHALLAAPLRLRAADLDGDQDLDLLAGHDSSLTSLWNHGDARFASEEEPAELDAGLPAAGDLDGDGDIEVAVRSRNRDKVLILEPAQEAYTDDCNGDGTPDDCQADCNGNGVADDCDTRSAVSSDCNANSIPDECEADCDRSGTPDDCDLSSGVSQDCNSNGIPDACDVSGTLVIETSQDFRGLAGTPMEMTFADVDGDLDLDLAFSAPGQVTIFENAGGRFTEGPRIQTIGFIRQIQALDIEPDGDMDLILTDTTRIVLLENDGQGRFSSRDIFSLASGQQIVSVVPSDLDRDGDLDFAALASTPGSLLILRNAGGTFVEGQTYTPGGSPNSLALTRLDSDEFVDVAILHNQGVLLLRGLGRGIFEEPREIPLDPPAVELVAADFDRDGDADLAAIPGGQSGLLVLLNDGEGAFSPAVRPYPDDFRVFTLEAAADLDLDGDVDLVGLGNPASGVNILLNDGAAGFKRVPLEDENREEVLERMGTAIALGDKDGDGDPDLAVGGRLSCLHCLLTNPGLLRIHESLSLPPRSADANRDGFPDECGRASFHRGDADANGITNISDPLFILRSLFLGGPEGSCREAFDANNDGKLELTDAVHVLGYLFLGGPMPAPPGPESVPCGEDPDPRGSAGDLGCASYAPCQ